ncbi:ThiF family adenylyltransferase [Mesorhizobium sp. M1066]|uniref:ThiF family adenylyltransferase n=1 Tax=Mesorhizobium opportunistum TaxID=593909 RepID=A0ABV1YB32_9HYPH|nr:MULTISPECIES: ThiF family adenylyltransferase [unclassified Mesorhizobium]ESX29357.1 hypothetical protein X765_14565 [Mesorhizobium sp. LSHC440B00]ESX43167.1 hypothetical protein X764_08345 [Mesorhizobium sp. LSHC440A00]ESY31508.1 hypothetical protein X749_09115 [Mesorhizobium sp. LNJC391B00]ESZ30475.1 hypothetical protein X734_04240 [Mesorhizobium sp. L2C084A000]
MLIALANHNPDIKRLLDRGFALRFDSGYLVVRDIPYLNAQLELCTGAFVTKLVFVDAEKVQQDDHQVFFAGGVPHEADGRPIPNLGGGPRTLALTRDDVLVERSFSNKPPTGFPDFFEKIQHYVALLSGPAVSRYPQATPLTFAVDHDVVADSVFTYQDTLTSRAEIGDLAARFKDEVVAIIGLGGTGAYVLDFMVKTNVREIRGFDADVFHVHNAYRSPGRLQEDDFKRAKADLYQDRYGNFRSGLKLERKFIDQSSTEELQGVTFAFVCVDKGSARAGVFDLLIGLKIPFIDVGLGLNRQQSALAGMLRATVYLPDDAEEIRAKALSETADQPGDEYRTNIQISELNAMNACIAVIRYKQYRGFYVEDHPAYHILMDTTMPRFFVETRHE